MVEFDVRVGVFKEEEEGGGAAGGHGCLGRVLTDGGDQGSGELR